MQDSNAGINLYELGFGKGFSDVAPRAQATKEKSEKL